MKFVIQRVLQGNVKVNEKIVGEIGPGIVVLVGFTHSDKKENLKFAANKLLSLRLWDNKDGVRWKECLKDRQFSLLIVSQFTLYSFLKGNKPDFHHAMEPEKAIILYDEFLKILKQLYIPDRIQSGMFGEMMQVSLINDGPVTINWDYPENLEKDNIEELIENKNEINNKMKNIKIGNNIEKKKNKINENITENLKNKFENFEDLENESDKNFPNENFKQPNDCNFLHIHDVNKNEK